GEPGVVRPLGGPEGPPGPGRRGEQRQPVGPARPAPGGGGGGRGGTAGPGGPGGAGVRGGGGRGGPRGATWRRARGAAARAAAGGGRGGGGGRPPPALLARLRELARPAFDPRSGAVLVSASYEGKLVKGVAEFDAVFQAHSLADGVATLALPLEGVRLEGDVL